MATNPHPKSAALSQQLLDILDVLSGGVHPGFRPAHAKGLMCSGTFTPAPSAATLTRAPHATRPSTPVIVRFSDSAGVPTVPDNDPRGASPRGFAVRFMLGDHMHTDIVAHSFNGFAVRTGEEFLEFLSTLPVSGPDAPKPTPLETFLASHPQAKCFVETPKPIPSSFARESYFAVTAFKFTSANGESRHGRFRIKPVAGNDYLSEPDAARQSANFLLDEMSRRLGQGPVQFRVFVQVAAQQDDVANASITWPDSRPEIEFGTITLTTRVNDAEPEMRKIIFDPLPRVDGIDSSGDPLTEVRSDLYLLSGRRRRANQLS